MRLSWSGFAGVSSVRYVAWLLGWWAASDSRFHLPELWFPSPKNVMHKIATLNSLTILLSLNEHPLGYHFNEIDIVVEIHKSHCENSWYGIKKEDFGFTPWCGVDVIYRVLCIDWIICIIFEAILFAATFGFDCLVFVWFFFPLGMRTSRDVWHRTLSSGKHKLKLCHLKCFLNSVIWKMQPVTPLKNWGGEKKLKTISLNRQTCNFCITLENYLKLKSVKTTCLYIGIFF